ncbi:MAG: hypothetical protein ACREJ2_16735 [Planctomycetota bacterium]
MRTTAAFLFGLLGLLGLFSQSGCLLDDPNVVPPGPLDNPPAQIAIPPDAAPPPPAYDHRLAWDYARLMNKDDVTSLAGESDLDRDVRALPLNSPQRAQTVDLLTAAWSHRPPPAVHVRAALVRLIANLAPADPRTTQLLLNALDDPAMEVRFRADNRLSDIYGTDVEFDPNETDPAKRSAAIARWKDAVAVNHPTATAVVP